MRKLLYAAAWMLAAFTACTKEDSNTAVGWDEGIQDALFTHISADIPATRTATDEAFNTSWNADDAIGLFAPEAYCQYGFEQGNAAYFTKGQAKNVIYKVDSGAGTASAAFIPSPNNILYYSGNFGWNATATNGIHNFYAYYPYRDGFGAAMKVDNVPVTLAVAQTQLGADSKAHLGALDFMHASLQLTKPTDAADKAMIDQELNLNFAHAFALLEFTITNSTADAVEVARVILEAQGLDLAGDFTFNLTDGSRTAGKKVSSSGQLQEGTTSQSITLATKNNKDDQALTLAAGASVKVYMVVNPVQMDQATVRVETNDLKGQSFTGTVDLSAGSYYTKSLVLNDLKPLYTFSVVDFEEAELNADGILQETTLIGRDDYDQGNFYGYTSNGVTLRTYIADYPFWCGFTLSNKTDMTTAGFENQYSVYSTAAYSGDKFAVAYDGGSMMGPGYQTRITLAQAKVVDHLYMTNSTYAVLSMKEGDSFAKIHTYEDQDWYKVTVTGYNDATATGSVDIYLSDFRTATSGGIVEEWKKVDLSALGAITHMDFVCAGSDVGDYGLNTPAYFCIDDIAVRD